MEWFPPVSALVIGLIVILEASAPIAQPVASKITLRILVILEATGTSYQLQSPNRLLPTGTTFIENDVPKCENVALLEPVQV